MSPAPNFIDRCIAEFDTALRTLCPPEERWVPQPYPVPPQEEMHDATMNNAEKRHSVGLMRINHAGEVCAQALYQGQALTSSTSHIQTMMQQAAAEEVAHLGWCERRLQRLGGSTSWLNPLWYAGSIAVGMIAGALGDRWNLSFVAETEHQVSTHLNHHLQHLPENDVPSRHIIQAMITDEQQHAQQALNAGGITLPKFVQHAMTTLAKLMTTITYYV